MRDRRYSREAVLAERRRARARRRACVAALALAGSLAIGGTAAFLFVNTDPVENTFAPSKVTTSVTEDFSDDLQAKEDVRVANTGDTKAYIRAAVVVTWQNAEGEIYGQAPASNLENSASNDYEITFVTEEQKDDEGKVIGSWAKSTADGFWYWSSPVEAGDSTGVLVETCSPVAGKAPEGYYLDVEILGSGIQADGEATTDVVLTNDGTTYSAGTAPATIAWGVTVNADGTLSVS